MNRVVNFFLALPISIFLNQSSTFGANSLTVEFNGELVSSTCKIATESLKKEVILYNLRWQQINENETSITTPFTISIDSCRATDLQKSVKLTWLSNQLVTIGDESFLTTQGTSGVILGIVDSNSNPIIWNKPIAIDNINVVDSTQLFNFGVFVRKPVVGDAKIGDFSSIVIFNIEYE